MKQLTTKEFYEIAVKGMLFIVDDMRSIDYPFRTGDVVIYIEYDDTCRNKNCIRKQKGECKGHGVFKIDDRQESICMSWLDKENGNEDRTFGHSYLIPFKNDFLTDDDFEI